MMVDLTTDNFHRVMADNPMVAVVFTGDPKADDDAAFTALRDSVADSALWHWGRVNATSSPDLAAMFGVSDRLPALMIMRDQVVLYCEPIDATPRDEIRNIIDRAAALDMDAVRRNISDMQNNQAWLFERRVCPTARRRR